METYTVESASFLLSLRWVISIQFGPRIHRVILDIKMPIVEPGGWRTWPRGRLLVLESRLCTHQAV